MGLIAYHHALNIQNLSKIKIQCLLAIAKQQKTAASFRKLRFLIDRDGSSIKR
ncbi:hypothetical protein J2X05_000223 [Cellvibrio fibrivorans]|uniref:Uncharacterized protein n=1 Tax=Cellvibrio fibrivorans TaxID=126350 RepID=A0ABU1USV3_9GAMM|nr:hypothetical protein [Cellvibrio fibrivorans]